MLLKPLSSLVIIECIVCKGEFILAIEDNLNNDVSAKSWVSPEADFRLFKLMLEHRFCI